MEALAHQYSVFLHEELQWRGTDNHSTTVRNWHNWPITLSSRYKVSCVRDSKTCCLDMYTWTYRLECSWWHDTVKVKEPKPEPEPEPARWSRITLPWQTSNHVPQPLGYPCCEKFVRGGTGGTRGPRLPIAKVHYPRIERGAQRWQRWILPLNQ